MKMSGVRFNDAGIAKIIAVVNKNLFRKPCGEVPDGTLLVEIDLKSGESDIALVFIGEDEQTLYYADDNEDVYTAWEWSDVSRYCTIESILPVRGVPKSMIKCDICNSDLIDEGDCIFCSDPMCPSNDSSGNFDPY